MIILTIRTDRPKAELGVYKNQKGLAYQRWLADRKLAETIHARISEILNKSSILLKDIEGIVCYEGPGSFTGLRVGLAVANALAYAQNIPVVARGGRNWRPEGIKDLLGGRGGHLALPRYGQPASTGPRPAK